LPIHGHIHKTATSSNFFQEFLSHRYLFSSFLVATQKNPAAPAGGAKNHYHVANIVLIQT